MTPHPHQSLNQRRRRSRDPVRDADYTSGEEFDTVAPSPSDSENDSAVGMSGLNATRSRIADCLTEPGAPLPMNATLEDYQKV